MKVQSKFLLSALAMIMSVSLNAQEHYTFNCRDYVSTDDNRAPQSAFSYDTESNSFSISSPGANNVAFKMNDALDGEYYIDPDETYFLISGENLSTTASSSYVWWLNGFNNGGQTSPDRIYDDNGTAVFLWDLKTNSAINGNFDFTKERISISSNGKDFIMAVGLTASNGESAGVISDCGYYAPFEVAAKHPSLMDELNFDDASLTAAIKDKILTIDSGRAEEVNAVSSADYVSAYSLYLKVRKEKEEDGGSHTGSYQQTTSGILAKYDDQSVRITFHNDSVLRVSKAYDLSLIKDSWAVVSEPASNVTFTVEENNGTVVLKSSKIRVEYILNKGVLTVFNSDGTRLVSEVKHRFVPTTDGPFSSYTVSQYFQLDSDERIYGMGQLQDGSLNRRGTVVHLEQDNRSICIPYFLSSKNYGLYWDNYSPTTFNDASSNTMFRSTGNAIDYYVLSAANSHEIQRSLRQLTGECQLPPLWNFGLYQSKERYTSASEVMGVVGKYRELKIPFDCLVQDWQYWGDNAHWNAMEFLNPEYSNYQEMIDYIHDNNAKIMISIWANFGPQTKPFAELGSKGLLFTAETWPLGAGVKPYNPYSSDARDIYWKYLWNGLVNKGIDAYWMDSTEPDFFGVEADKDNVALPGQTWRSLRNAFPLATVQGVSEHHLAQPELSGKRVSIMTRSGYLGMQRTGAYVWSADITSSWTTLANQITSACNLSESGLPYWNSDTGGFFKGSYGGVNDPAWRSLYVRWTQFSTFTPMLRFHGTDTPREPWQFGSAGDARGEYDNLVKYIKLRYSLLPYLYSTAHKVRTDAQGFMQSMPIAFSNDSQSYDVKDQYMFGSSFLVAPVIQDGVNGRNVYLPKRESGKWIDFWTGYTFAPGQTVYKVAPMDIIPLYVKTGSIIPWGPEVQYSTEKSWDNLEIRVYPGSDGSFVLYEDEFDNQNYREGKYTEIPFTWDEASKTLTIGKRVGEYSGMLSQRTFNIVVVSSEKGNGDVLSGTYDAVVNYTGDEVSVKLETSNEEEPLLDECTDYIVNPSFEADGSALNKVAPQGWTVDSATAWWGVNLVGAGSTGDPQPTDGSYIFGVWDGTSTSASISQTVNLPAGKYMLTVDMHASNRDNAIRVGDQCLFANDEKTLFSESVSTAGVGDAYPMQTISVKFTVAADNDPVNIGVSTANAPVETWFKIDNFRLYKVTNDDATGINGVTGNKKIIQNDVYYNLSGIRVSRPKHGIYIKNGKKVLF